MYEHTYMSINTHKTYMCQKCVHMYIHNAYVQTHAQIFCLFVFFFGCTMWQGSNPCPLQQKHRVLTIGLPGNSPCTDIYNYDRLTYWFRRKVESKTLQSSWLTLFTTVRQNQLSRRINTKLGVLKFPPVQVCYAIIHILLLY